MNVPIAKLDVKKYIMSLFALQQDIVSVVQPLFQLLNVNCFAYKKIYPGQVSVYLTTCPLEQEVYINGKFYRECTNDIEKYESGMFLFDDMILTKAMKDWRHTIKNDFNFANVLSIIEKQQDFVEIFFFSTSSVNASINHFYLNHIDIFRNFCCYFRDNGKQIIKSAEKHKILWDIETDNIFVNPGRLDKKFQAVDVLSSREYESLSYLAKGKTVKEAAKILSISHRTIENYIIRAKIKTNCVSTSKLIDWYWENLE